VCFSATASFITAAVTGIAGVATISRVQDARALPLAAIPLIFASQQALEGMLWLTLPVSPDGPVSSLLTQLFLIVSLVFWPVFAPFAAHQVEPDRSRRLVMIGCIVVGIAVAAYFLTTTLAMPRTACISGGHIVYFTGVSAPLPIGSLYLLATGIALLLSSHRAVALLGAIVVIGSIVSYFLYWDALVSVWCFFAAGASGVLLFHFEQVRTARRAEARTAGAMSRSAPD
jgi:hypothetical protein